MVIRRTQGAIADRLIPMTPIEAKPNSYDSPAGRPGPSVNQRTPPAGRGSPSGSSYTISHDQSPVSGGAEKCGTTPGSTGTTSGNSMTCVILTESVMPSGEP